MAITDTLIPAVDISDKQTVPVTLNGKNILICKANGEFYAVDNQCTHQRAELTGGRIRNCYLACPLHGVRFDLRTGQPLGELTRVPLKTYDVSLADNGNLQLEQD
ncbi:Rieske 2Fe-2S domain-containing protein [Porticoccaceae bacterium]|jgi:3-phenylpropionate/trans-cinnamate dioxygenase ferredoxin subunit|nr:Rieske 2Fe-2S domain-containing protein [Porticoccaceae bacterium]